MPNSVHELERRRADIVQKIAGLGDLRPGSITTTQGKCGKPTCHCAEADHPGHGPHWRLTYKSEGRTRTQSLPSAQERQKAEDRKSTRLNSSHRTISYAGFCLKKKTKS